MNPDQIAQLNAESIGLGPTALLQKAFGLPENSRRPLVTTNFRPYEAVILHMATQVRADVPILWVDHGANFPETYRFAEACKHQLNLNVISFVPKVTTNHWLAIHGPNLPAPDEVARVEDFSRIMKLEPFQRGMGELSPTLWITALRREQNSQRASSLAPFQWDETFQCLKVNPLLDWTKDELESYLAEHQLPNERTYYDPAKGDENHECGLHARLTTATN